MSLNKILFKTFIKVKFFKNKIKIHFNNLNIKKNKVKMKILK